MSYTIEKASLITNQLNKFTTSYAHHLVGQFANLEFWLSETQDALKAIDGYYQRYQNLRKAQKDWVRNHGTIVYGYCSICGGKCEFDDGTPSPPVKIDKEEIETARQKAKDAVYNFLLRCFRSNLLDEKSLSTACERIGTSIEPEDLRRKQ